jgi:hypothetical protein
MFLIESHPEEINPNTFLNPHTAPMTVSSNEDLQEDRVLLHSFTTLEQISEQVILIENRLHELQGQVLAEKTIVKEAVYLKEKLEIMFESLFLIK